MSKREGNIQNVMSQKQISSSGEKRKTGYKAILICSLAFALFFIALNQDNQHIAPNSNFNKNTAIESNEEPEVDTDSLEYKLAALNAGYEVDADDETIKQFADLLDSIESKTKNTRQEISDMTVRAQEILKERGTDIGLLDLMTKLDASMPEEARGFDYLDYSEICAVFLTLMRK